jgi:BMFP domain-containing protein YqiC
MSARRAVFDDVAKLATSAAGLVQGAGREVESALRQRLEQLLERMDLVPRDEFDAVKEMAAAARTENEALSRRLATLENAIQSDKMTTRADTKAEPAKRKSQRGAKTAAARPRKTAMKSAKNSQKSKKK